jgi:peptidoglycan/LPS O-acetylase OafA/YrhL
MTFTTQKPNGHASLTKKETLPFLDILRGMAALGVLFFHIVQHYGWENFPQFLGFKVIARGWMGVDFLFVLSGFLIANSIIYSEKHPAPLRVLRYICSRGARIVPLYALNIAIILLLLEPEILNSRGFSYHIWLKTLFLHNFDFFAFHSINPVLWSIAVEVQFYILIFVTRRWWLNANPLKFCGVMLLATWAIRSGAWWYASATELPINKLPILFLQLPTMLDLFALGVSVALLRSWKSSRGLIERNRQRVLSVTILTGLICFSIYNFNSTVWDNPLMVIFWRSTLGLFFAGLILSAIQFNPPRIGTHIYSSMSYLGLISYGIYVWHYPIMEALSPYLHEYPAILSVCIVAITLVISAITWEVYEKPIIKISKGLFTKQRHKMGILSL